MKRLHWGALRREGAPMFYMDLGIKIRCSLLLEAVSILLKKFHKVFLLISDYVLKYRFCNKKTSYCYDVFLLIWSFVVDNSFQVII